MSVEKHLNDIDFRSRGDRSKNAVPDFIMWYETLIERPYSPENQAQIRMLSSVLWYLLPKADYKRLTSRK